LYLRAPGFDKTKKLYLSKKTNAGVIRPMASVVLWVYTAVFLGLNVPGLGSTKADGGPAPPSALCQNGILHQNRHCCAKACGRCGGAGCGSLPGGAAQCCYGGIESSGRICHAPSDTSCVIGAGSYSVRHPQSEGSVLEHFIKRHSRNIRATRALTTSTTDGRGSAQVNVKVQNGINPWNVAVVHIPKSAGSSIAELLSAGMHPSCAEYTGNLSLCGCSNERCRARAKVAVVEAPFSIIKALLRPVRTKWLWVAVIRRPERWFYSAVGQWCANNGKRSIPCKPNASITTLLRASWFNPNTGWNRERSGAQKGSVKYYFFGPNLQTYFLGSMFLEDAWIVGTLEHGIHALVAAIWSTALNSTPVRLKHVNEEHWPLLKSFKDNVPWTDVKRYYAVDDAFYKHVSRQKGSCIGHRADHLRLPESTLDWASGVTWD
jgi:hypothetical protein